MKPRTTQRTSRTLSRPIGVVPWVAASDGLLPPLTWAKPCGSCPASPAGSADRPCQPPQPDPNPASAHAPTTTRAAKPLPRTFARRLSPMLIGHDGSMQSAGVEISDEGRRRGQPSPSGILSRNTRVATVLPSSLPPFFVVASRIAAATSSSVTSGTHRGYHADDLQDSSRKGADGLCALPPVVLRVVSACVRWR